MKACYLLFLSAILISCNSQSSDSTHQTEDKEMKEHHHHHNEEGGSGHAVNEHMHQSSVEELIQRFESPERDAYQQPEKVLDYLGDLSAKKVMDIGAGSGYFSVKLAEKGAHVIAADVNEEFQAFIRKRITENNLQHIETRKIPYDGPGLQEGEVDMVLIVNTYHHIDKRPTYFSQVKKGTKENGELVIIDFYKYELPIGPSVDHKIAMDKVINELKEAGYQQFEVDVNLLPYQYIIKAR